MANCSPLHELTCTAGAIFTESVGWQMPAHYGDPLREYQTAQESAALFDISHRGKLEVTGPESAAFLHNLSTNDIKSLTVGGGCEAYFCDHRAKVKGQALIYRTQAEGISQAFSLDVTPGYEKNLLQHLDRHLIAEQVELSDRTMDFGQLHLAGPKAKVVLERALGTAIPELPEFSHREHPFGSNATCRIRRHDALGIPGYDILCSAERTEEIWNILSGAGSSPAGLESYEILRIEAITPIYGIDIDENRFVMEVARALRAVSYAKGCYLGQEPIVMARDRAGHVNRAFLALKILTGGPLPQGTNLFRDGMEVGLVTSSTVSPRYGIPIALGYVRRGHQEPGTHLTTTDNRVVEIIGGV